jgi:hypothetical protein
MTRRHRRALVPGLALVMLLTSACRSPAAPGVEGASGGSASLVRLELPAALEAERDGYRDDVLGALADAADCFRNAGVDLPGGRLIESVIVFESPSAARYYISKTYKTPPESIPETFSGTVEGATLLLVSREAYREVWGKQYADWPWTDRTYHQLIVHELAHRAHESIALSRYATSDAMGPGWFFEGLAVVCARQFEVDQPPMSRDEVENLVGNGHAPAASYPLYGRIVRALIAEYGMNTLISGAAQPTFPDLLWSERTDRGPDAQ